MNLHTDCGFIDLPPEQAWKLLDKLADYEAMYGVSQGNKEVRIHGEGPKKLYDPKSEEVDKDVKIQFLEDELNKMRRKMGHIQQTTRACERVWFFEAWSTRVPE